LLVVADGKNGGRVGARVGPRVRRWPQIVSHRDRYGAKPEKFFRDTIRAGYRAPYLKELAQRVAAGALDVESWLTNAAPLDDLIKEMKSVKGVGNYAAENLLKLIGRYDGLALDSWTRAQFARARNNGRAASDKKIARFLCAL